MLLLTGVFFFCGIIVISSDTLIGCLGLVWLEPDGLLPDEPDALLPLLAPLCTVYTWFSNSLYCPNVAVHTVHLYDRWAGFRTYCQNIYSIVDNFRYSWSLKSFLSTLIFQTIIFAWTTIIFDYQSSYHLISWPQKTIMKSKPKITWGWRRRFFCV